MDPIILRLPCWECQWNPLPATLPGEQLLATAANVLQRCICQRRPIQVSFAADGLGSKMICDASLSQLMLGLRIAHVAQTITACIQGSTPSQELPELPRQIGCAVNIQTVPVAADTPDRPMPSKYSGRKAGQEHL